MLENKELNEHEIEQIKVFLCGLIKTSDNAVHLKSILVHVLRIPQETPEISQIHELMLDIDKRFKQEKEEREKSEAKQNERLDKQERDMMWIKRGLAGLGALIPIAQAFLSLIGLG